MDNITETTATKETTMSTETATEGKKGKKGKKTGSASNGNGLAKLAKLERQPSKSVQETFRATPEEHNTLVAEASKGGFGSMSDFYRSKLGLDE